MSAVWTPPLGWDDPRRGRGEGQTFARLLAVRDGMVLQAIDVSELRRNDPAKLSYHESETLPHLRIEECQSCGVYMKSVDLRQLGTAVPLVEDIASVELDIWAQEQGLQKIERNVLGL